MPLSALDRAIEYAVEKHAGQVDKAGEPYILHCLAVMNAGTNEYERIVGVLHDVIEDTDATVEEVEALFGATIAGGVEDLTRLPDETYAEFIERVDLSPAKPVKINDLRHNLGRMDMCFDPDRSLMKRYEKALEALGAPAGVIG